MSSPALQVTAVTRYAHSEPHAGISAIHGAGWTYSKADAIALIESGRATFYTNVDNRVALMGVVNSLVHGRYLRTKRDGVLTNDLLALPNQAAAA